MTMKLVILESPYAGHGESDGEVRARIRSNVEYARRCIRDCLLKGESPIASHLLYTQEGILRDEIQEERALGIAAGLEWRRVADYSVFYTDKGWSHGMLRAFKSAQLENRKCVIRALDMGLCCSPTEQMIDQV